MRIAAPQGDLPAGRFQHPVIDLKDQRALFGDRNKLIRHDHAALRMNPAQQCLRPHRAVIFIHLDLVIQMQLPQFYGTAQIAHQFGMRLHVMLHGGIEKMHCIAPGILGLVHRQIGMLKQFTHRLFVAMVQTDADTG